MEPSPLVRTLYTWEILSDRFLDPDSPSDLAYLVSEGDCSGSLSLVTVEEVAPSRMAELLLAQGSDPEFLLGPDFDPDSQPDPSSGPPDTSIQVTPKTKEHLNRIIDLASRAQQETSYDDFADLMDYIRDNTQSAKDALEVNPA